MTPEEVLAIVNKFCGDEDGRYTLSKPFRHGVHVCATNGRLAVRVLASQCAPIPDPEPFDQTPPIHTLRWGTEKYLPDPEPISDALKEPEWIECTVCEGRCVHWCRECEDDHPCKACNEEGGYYERMAVRFSTGALFNRKYIGLLKECGAELYLIDPSVPSPDSKPARFTIGPIEGLMMGIKPDMYNGEIIDNAPVEAAR